MHKPLVFGILTIILLSACTPQTQSENTKPLIAATFYPVAEVARNVVGDTVEVYTIVPQGVEPHDYEPTPGDLAEFQRSTVFVTMGLEFEHIEETLLQSRTEQPVVIAVAEAVSLLPASGEDEHEHGDREEAAEHEEHEAFDPHVWLSPKNMITMTRTVELALSKQYPDHAATFKTNADNYVSRLEALDTRYRTELDSCRTRTMLVSHRAFAYLADAYNLEQIAIGGLSPDAEPTPQELAALVEAAKENNIKYVFSEELVDPRISKTIAAEVGAQVLVLSPVEGVLDEKDTYISVMERNLDNLKIALECQ